MSLEIKPENLCGELAPLFSIRAAKFGFAVAAFKRVNFLGSEPVLRGKIGFHLKRACCPFPDFRTRPCEPGPHEPCALAENCLYVSLFAPITVSGRIGAESKKQLPPPVRPFVISLSSKNGTIRPGETGVAEFTLFGPAIRHSGIFLDAAAMSAKALGLDLKRIRRLYTPDDHGDAPPLADWISQNGERRPAPRPQPVFLRFATPTRLGPVKGAPKGVIPFPLVVKSVVRRLRDLKRAYGPDEDMGKTGSRFHDTAAQVETETCRLQWKKKNRFSHRQNKPVYLDGITGEISYAAPAGLFLPLLQAGQFVHVGKGTSCGNGRMEVVFNATNSG